jgi:succinoglycan biosynthesis transport protein ExoP
MGTQIPTKEQSLNGSKNPHPFARDAFWVWNKPLSDEENPGLRPIFAVLRRRSALIIGVAVVVTTTVSAWTATRTPKYEGRFQIMVEPLKTTDSELLKLLSQTLQQNVNDITRQNTTALDYNALFEVLKSPKLIDPVVAELRAKYPEINYDQLVGNDGSGKSSNREGMLLMTRIAKGKDESRVIEVRYRDAKPAKIQFVLDQVSQAYRKYSIEQQQTNLRQGMKFVEQQIPKLQLRVNTLQGQLQTFQQRYSLYNPQLQGEQLLKRLDDIKVQRLETERKFLEARSLYSSLQNQLGMQQNDAIAASALSESPQYQQILTRIRELEAKIATESVRFSEASPQIQDLREQRQKLLPLLNTEARLALGNRAPGQGVSPSVVTYQNSVRRDLTKQLADSTNQMQSLDASLRALVQAEFQINEQIQQYPVVSRQYSNLQRDLQVATDTLNQLLIKQEALRVDAAQQEVPWEVIMPPTLPRDKSGQYVAVSSAASGNLLLGGVAGLLLGTAAAFMLENLKNVVRDPEEAKRIAKLPHLGSVPFCRSIGTAPIASNVVGFDVKDGREFKSHVAQMEATQPAVLTQAFCSIYNRVQAYSVEAQMRSIAVTSTTAREGRTTIAANLAQIAAEAGQKVLLVDADWRQPQLHIHMGISNTEGFSEVLCEGLDFKLAITRSLSEENLFILTAGKAKVNPSKMFSSKEMQNFVAQSQANFDFVIYDTPHLLGRLDAMQLCDRVDGILLVVGLGLAVRPSFKQVVEELRGTKVPILGMVTNNLE